MINKLIISIYRVRARISALNIIRTVWLIKLEKYFVFISSIKSNV